MFDLFQGSWLEYLLKCGAIEIFINSILCCYITKFYVDFCLCAQGSNNVVKDKKRRNIIIIINLSVCWI